jgi:acyl carrier protein
MSDTYTEVKAIIKDLLGADESKITPEARFREELEADSLDQVYHCGNIEEDIISLPDKIIAKNGAVIWKKKVTGIDELGFGFLLIDEGDCNKIIHKTGYQIGEDCIDDTKILNGKFIAIQKNNQWSIWTLTGRSLIQNLEDVFSTGEVIGLKKNNSIKLHSSASLSKLPPPPLEPGGTPEYDAVTVFNTELMLVIKNGQSGLIDQSLNTMIALGDQSFSAAFFGVMARDSSGVRIYNSGGKKSKTFKKVLTQEPWVVVKDSVWSLFDVKTMEPFVAGYDTIFFVGSFAVGYKKDSCSIFFRRHHHWKGRVPAALEFVPGKDSSAFLMIQQGERKTLYNEHGLKLFTTTFDKIQSAGDDLFIVYKNEKKGLMTAQGKLLLPVEYDAIGTVNNGIVSLLKSMKFGLFDCVRKKSIPPSYSKNLIPYNSSLITAYKDGLHGFVAWDNKAVSKFEFNDIQFWNDTTALVKKNSQWMLYEIKTKKIVLDQIKDFTFIRNTSSEKLAIVYQGSNHGVLHNQKGTIIPISYTDVINVGSAEKPLYFTEKNVEEAAIVVVMYYNDQGTMVRKEVYDHEDYGKIYCDEH